MAEWSKALVLGTSHFGGAGSNPVPVIISGLVEVKLMLAIESMLHRTDTITCLNLGEGKCKKDRDTPIS